MTNRYAAVSGPKSTLPTREFLISQAWGSLPVSYIQDHEIFNECSFLDLKINKWEINSKWSSQQDSEPWIRIEIFRGEGLKKYLQHQECRLPIEVAKNALVIFDLDEGGSVLDDILLLRLVAVFYGSFQVYRWDDGFKEISADLIASLPELRSIHERLIKCERT